MLWECFAAGRTGALHKMMGSMWKEIYVEILKQHLKTSSRKLKLGCKCVFQTDNDPKHTTRLVTKELKDNKGSVRKLTKKKKKEIPQKIISHYSGI